MKLLLQHMQTQDTDMALRFRLATIAERETVAKTAGDLGAVDTVVIAEIEGRIVGSVAMRMTPMVHDMTVRESPISRRVADGLLNYCMGFVRASGPNLEAMFLVDPTNDQMHRWLQEHGAELEYPANVYFMEAQ